MKNMIEETKHGNEEELEERDNSFDCEESENGMGDGAASSGSHTTHTASKPVEQSKGFNWFAIGVALVALVIVLIAILLNR
jgi:hypothetical protein